MTLTRNILLACFSLIAFGILFRAAPARAQHSITDIKIGDPWAKLQRLFPDPGGNNTDGPGSNLYFNVSSFGAMGTLGIFFFEADTSLHLFPRPTGVSGVFWSAKLLDHPKAQKYYTEVVDSLIAILGPGKAMDSTSYDWFSETGVRSFKLNQDQLVYGYDCIGDAEMQAVAHLQQKNGEMPHKKQYKGTTGTSK